jgi:hypothetical protein
LKCDPRFATILQAILSSISQYLGGLPMPSIRQTLTPLIIAATLLLSVGCTSDSNEDDAQLDAAHDSSDTEKRDGDPNDSDALDGGSCGPLLCDAIYIPPVTISFNEPSGADYCGDVTVTWWPEGEPENSREKTCSCNNADGADAGIGGPDANDTTCVIDANTGESTVIQAEADGYATYETTVTLPCSCNPSQRISVDFEQE